MVANHPPKSLRVFQRDFSESLRSQTSPSSRSGIPDRPAEIYRELVFNNLCGFIDKCFPVAQTLIDESTWLELKKRFFKLHPCHSPVFNDIPKAYCDFIAKDNNQTQPWLAELLDYEWLELSVDLNLATVNQPTTNFTPDLSIIINPTLVNQMYAWPVHLICRDFLPDKPCPTYLLIYRNYQHQVLFMEINPMSASLLGIIAQHPGSNCEQILDSLCALQPDFDRDSILTFGYQLIVDLITRNAILVAEKGNSL